MLQAQLCLLFSFFGENNVNAVSLNQNYTAVSVSLNQNYTDKQTEK